MNKYVLALDQGTTSSRAIIFDENGNIVSVGQKAFDQHFPSEGWVEHDPIDYLETEYAAISEALAKSGLSGKDISCIGITNQRETTIVWDKKTGKPVYNAIVWQCRRTAKLCDELIAAGWQDMIKEKCGLLIDAYFSATKIAWILENVPGVRARAEAGELLFGTVETWLIWNLTGGKVHVTDYSNASRTMLFNIHTLSWDEELCGLLHIPMCMLPEPVGNSQIYGYVHCADPRLAALNGMPVSGALGDQQAALLGQGCLEKGQAKNTYGTGCFTLMNAGNEPLADADRLLNTVAWNIGGETVFALEGSVFNAGSSIQWLRDELQIINTAAEVSTLAETVPDNGGVYLVSAFTGLGAPHWDMYARGIIAGITRGTTRGHIARACVEGICYQVNDLLSAMNRAAGAILDLKVDGGASVSNIMMQFQSDISGIPIDRPAIVETTALGAAFAAGLACGVWDELSDIRSLRTSERIFFPHMERKEAERLIHGWNRAVERAKGWVETD